MGVAVLGITGITGGYINMVDVTGAAFSENRDQIGSGELPPQMDLQMPRIANTESNGQQDRRDTKIAEKNLSYQRTVSISGGLCLSVYSACSVVVA